MAAAFENSILPCFQTATSIRLQLTKRFTTFPSDTELKQNANVVTLSYHIRTFLKSVPRLGRRHWQHMLRRAYPELMQDTLQTIMTKLVVRCWKLRSSATHTSSLHDFLEFCAGEGNLSAACLQASMKGHALDVRYTPHHNMLTRIGLRCWLDCISESKPEALIWFGTRCSSFVTICSSVHKRCAANGFWGDQERRFVRDGNIMMVPQTVAWGVQFENGSMRYSHFYVYNS